MEKSDNKNNAIQHQEDISTASEESGSLNTSISSSSLGKTAEKYRYELLSQKIADDFRKQQVEINRRNKEFQEKYLESFKKEYKDDVAQKTKDLEDKIENSKLSVIETLGMFIALFTFISVDFQVFKSYRDPMAISALTAILIGAIFLFIVVFDYFILQARKVRKTEENINSQKYLEDDRVSRNRKIIFGVSLVLIFLGINAFSKTTSDENVDIRDQIRKEVLNSVQSDLDIQKNELEKINDNNGILIKNTNDNIVRFKECVKDFGFTYKCFE